MDRSSIFKSGIALIVTLLTWNLSVSQTNPCIQDTSFHFVVLGSSTAAGAGASPSDSSWVNRYRDYLQSLNPAYQLTNLAVGGFTTYRLMPTGFTPPSGRPSPDVNRNITAGLALNPDAIIVNLPSNDVSSGYTVAEQLENFDTIVSHAQAAGVPIWICTTQPKNYGNNPIPIQKQQDVRDSIWAKYSPMVLDFWTGLADSTNQLDAFYDSGDGTHLNNSGHYLLFTRAVDGAIPNALVVPPNYVDYTPHSLEPVFAPDCGDSAATFSLEILNRGMTDNGNVNVQVDVVRLPNNPAANISTQLTGGIPSCDLDSITFNVNTLVGGTYEFTAIVSSGVDPRADNDTLVWTADFLGQPIPLVTPDTGCGTGNLLLMASAGMEDSIRWFDAPTGGNFLGGGTMLPLSNLGSSTTFYAEAIRGDFFYRNEIFTTNNTNIDFNGTMFDLVADSNLVLDSFDVKIATLGTQTVDVYTKQGSHLGFETNSGAWNYYASYTVQVNSASDFETIGNLNISMNAGDSLAIYLQMQNSGSRLSYQSMSNPATRSTDELTMITGSGSAFNFGGNYYPRDWNGRVYYHFGTLPDGECLGPRVPVEAWISDPQIFLGNDTILNLSSSITLTPGTGFSTYTWSDGSMGSTLTLDGNNLGLGVYSISVDVTDSLGCIASDTIIVVFAPLVGTDPSLNEDLLVWPNPSHDLVNVALPAGTESLELLDLQGKVLGRWTVTSDRISLPVQDQANGLYFLKTNGLRSVTKMVTIHH